MVIKKKKKIELQATFSLNCSCWIQIFCFFKKKTFYLLKLEPWLFCFSDICNSIAKASSLFSLFLTLTWFLSCCHGYWFSLGDIDTVADPMLYLMAITACFAFDFGHFPFFQFTWFTRFWFSCILGLNDDLMELLPLLLALTSFCLDLDDQLHFAKLWLELLCSSWFWFLLPWLCHILV
jgi:hypothetical protein